MQKELVVVAHPQDVHPVAGQGAGGQYVKDRTRAVLTSVGLELKKPMEELFILVLGLF